MAESTPSAGTASGAGGPSMSFLDHLRELCRRLFHIVAALLITTMASVFLAKRVLVFLIAPMGNTLPQALKPTESIVNYMKVALICGVTLAMPFIVYEIGAFLMPALTKQERRYLLVLVPGATLCFLAGVAFAYYLTIPSAIPFLQGFLSDIIQQNWAVGDYLSFVTSLLFWIGVAFELPLFVFILAKLGIVDARFLRKNFKFAVLIIAIIAAAITPTVDPFNMMLVMAPLLLLYLVGILLAMIARPKPRTEE
jgi:sec-independent protein translocase protein TatC